MREKHCSMQTGVLYRSDFRRKYSRKMNIYNFLFQIIIQFNNTEDHLREKVQYVQSVPLSGN